MENLPIARILFLFIFVYSIINPCYAKTNVNEKIQTHLDRFRKESNSSAAVLSIHFPNNKIANYVSGTTVKSTRTNPNPPNVTVNNLFQIGSITKSFTAVIILQLEAEGKLSINDTIYDITKKYGTWLPLHLYDAWKKISIKQLLNMTSGIFDVTEDEEFTNSMAKHPQKTWKSEEILKYGFKHEPYFSPGQGWHYSNGAYNILGMLIEKVTQNSFENEINTRILQKYHLNNTFYLPYNFPKNIFDRMAHGYVYSGGGFSPPMISGTDMTHFNLSAAGPSGALVSNSMDITKWVQLIFSGKLLSRLQMNELLTAVCMGVDKSCRAGEVLSANSHSQGFSLGLVRMYDPDLGIIWIYFGDTPGYSSGFMWLPNKNIALAMTLNATSLNGKKLVKKLGEIAKLIQD